MLLAIFNQHVVNTLERYHRRETFTWTNGHGGEAQYGGGKNSVEKGEAGPRVDKAAHRKPEGLGAVFVMLTLLADITTRENLRIHSFKTSADSSGNLHPEPAVQYTKIWLMHHAPWTPNET
jgi:hypothetical protein